MFEVNEMTGAQGAQLLAAGAIFFTILLWAVPALHRQVLPSSMRNDAVARAATVAAILVLAAAAATIGMRGTTSAVARSDNTMSVGEIQQTVNTRALPSPQWDLY